MSALEVIARACTPKPDECYHGSASFSLTSGEFHCLVKMWERELPRADAIISALTTAGYVILSPDEVRGMERDRQAVEFAARWCWRTDPPNANNKLTDAERLSVIKHHPIVKKYGQPHIGLAERENLLKGSAP